MQKRMLRVAAIPALSVFYGMIVAVLVKIDASRGLGAALVGAGTIVGALGVIVALQALFAQMSEAKAQRSYELIDKYVDFELKLAERYIKNSFSIDQKDNKFDFTYGLVSSKGQCVTLFNKRRARKSIMK